MEGELFALLPLHRQTWLNQINDLESVDETEAAIQKAWISAVEAYVFEKEQGLITKNSRNIGPKTRDALLHLIRTERVGSAVAGQPFQLEILPEAGRSLSQKLAKNLMGLYSKIAKQRGWRYRVVSESHDRITLEIDSTEAALWIRNEEGIHTYHAADASATGTKKDLVFTNAVTIRVSENGVKKPRIEDRYVRRYDTVNRTVSNRGQNGDEKFGDPDSFFDTPSLLINYWSWLEIGLVKP